MDTKLKTSKIDVKPNKNRKGWSYNPVFKILAVLLICFSMAGIARGIFVFFDKYNYSANISFGDMFVSDYKQSSCYFQDLHREESFIDTILELKSEKYIKDGNTNRRDEFAFALSWLEVSRLLYYIDADGEIYSNASLKEIMSDPEYKKITHNGNSEATYTFNSEYLQKQSEEFWAVVNAIWMLIRGIAFCLLLFLLALCYLLYAAGRTASNPNELTMHPIDKIPTELFFVLWVTLVSFSVMVVGDGFPYAEGEFLKNVILSATSLFCLLNVPFILSLVRHIKNKTLLKNLFVYKAASFVYNNGKKIFDAGSPMLKAILLIAALGLLSAIPFMFFITIPLSVYFVYKQVNKFIRIKKGLQRVKSGVYDEKILVDGKSELTQLAQDINCISAGLGEEVERRIKSERLKTELIVNVSHDIKTPLTSVISYAYLLQQEDIDNEDARKYIDIIAQKAGRLKTLTDDLFDAAKASSGNIVVNFEDVDLNALITQGLGEMDDKIKESRLDFRVNMPDKHVIARADGKLLWRVLENLLSNVFKYSLSGSRVYLRLWRDSDFAYIELKNISAQELDIPEDEILERFKRGDTARSSEGSGLGLDIARSLMLCQNGELSVSIDGDLFKVRLQMNNG